MKNKEEKEILVNYHTHCDKCKHAGGKEEDYVRKAIENGFDILGMSDHIPYPDGDFGCRMEYSQLNPYLDELTRLKEIYSDKIQLLRGFESEFLPQYSSYYESLLKDERCDYLILGQHFFSLDNGDIKYVYDCDDTKWYIEYAKKAVEAMRTGYIKMLCHPDLIGVGNFKISKDHLTAFDIIVEGAVKYDFILEYNANGLRREIKDFGGEKRKDYPITQLWEMIENSGAKVICGADSHSPDALYDDIMKEGIKFLNNGKFNVKLYI